MFLGTILSMACVCTCAILNPYVGSFGFIFVLTMVVASIIYTSGITCLRQSEKNPTEVGYNNRLTGKNLLELFTKIVNVTTPLSVIASIAITTISRQQYINGTYCPEFDILNAINDTGLYHSLLVAQFAFGFIAIVLAHYTYKCAFEKYLTIKPKDCNS